MENHIDPSTMLEFIEGLAAMAVLDQDGVYTYVSRAGSATPATPHRSHRPEGLGNGARHPRHRGLPHGQAGLCQAVNANGPAFTSYFPRFDRDGKLCGLFLYVIVQGMETLRT